MYPTPVGAFSCLISCYEAGAVIIPILQVAKLRHREAKGSPAPAHAEEAEPGFKLGAFWAQGSRPTRRVPESVHQVLLN